MTIMLTTMVTYKRTGQEHSLCPLCVCMSVTQTLRVSIRVCLCWCWQQWWFMTGWETFIVPLSARPHNSMLAKCGNISFHNNTVLCQFIMILKIHFLLNLIFFWCCESFFKSVAKNSSPKYGHCFDLIKYTSIIILELLCPGN